MMTNIFKDKRCIFHAKTIEKKTWKFWNDLFVELQNQIPEFKTFGLGISLTSVKFKELYLKYNLEKKNTIWKHILATS